MRLVKLSTAELASNNQDLLVGLEDRRKEQELRRQIKERVQALPLPGTAEIPIQPER